MAYADARPTCQKRPRPESQRSLHAEFSNQPTRRCHHRVIAGGFKYPAASSFQCSRQFGDFTINATNLVTKSAHGFTARAIRYEEDESRCSSRGPGTDCRLLTRRHGAVSRQSTSAVKLHESACRTTGCEAGCRMLVIPVTRMFLHSVMPKSSGDGPSLDSCPDTEENISPDGDTGGQ